MSAEEVILTLVVILMISALVALANYADQKKHKGLKRVLSGLVLLTNLFLLFSYGLVPVLTANGTMSASEGEIPPTENEALWGLTLTLVVALFTSLLLWRVVREKLIVLFPRYQPVRSQQEVLTAQATPDLQPKLAEIPLFPQMLNYYTSSSSATLPPPSLPIGFEVESQNTRFGAYRVRGFDPDSAVHMMGLVLVIYLVGVQIINFALGGGMTGVAESFEDSITTVDLLLNAAPLIILSLVGVGLGLRRNWSQTMQRLGLGLPTFEGLAVAGVLTIGLLFFVGIVSVIWMGLVSGETFEEQTEASDALSNSVSTLWLAFMVAATAAIGEEIAFRGALQPVFGLWPTSIIFALTHIQYTLTPASLIILGVALGFGWMRKRYNTTAAIATHFMYNFIPLALVVIAPEEEAFLRVLGLM